MTLPYQKHSKTSQEAANRNVSASNQRAMIYALISSNGIKGMTNSELWTRTFIVPGTVSARLRDLELDGSIVKTSTTRLNKETNRNQSVYVAKQYADDVFIESTKKMPKSRKMQECLERIRYELEVNGRVYIYEGDDMHQKISEALK